jgi:CRP-like cAMP-binding protein
MLQNGQLEKFSIFSKLSQKSLFEISNIGRTEEYGASEIIFYQGERARHLYGILEGIVNLNISYQEKIVKTDVIFEESILDKSELVEKSIVVDTLGTGDIIAWSALVGPGFFTATARCKAPTRLISLPQADLKNIMDRTPDIGYTVMAGLAEVVSLRRQKVTEKLIEVWGEYFDKEDIGE